MVVASIIIVVVLSAVAIFSALGNATGDDGEAIDETPAPAGRAFPGSRVQVGDATLPLSVGCMASVDGEPGRTDVFMVVLENLGADALTYVVAARLTDEDGRSEQLVIDVPRLQPGQEFEQFLVPGQDLARIEDCAVTAVQTDNQVLLFN